MYKAILFTAFALLQACVNHTELAKQAVEEELIERRDVDYQNLEVYPGAVVCGLFNSYDKWGRGGPEFSRFIVRGGEADLNPSNDDWAIFCSKDSAAAMQARLGIGPLDADNAALQKIHHDLATLDAALQQYLQDNFRVPSPRQGLQALAAETPYPPKPRVFPQGGYLESIPSDPWGRPYRYIYSSLGGVSPNYDLETLGADGTKGGEGENADVGTHHLKYLDHISSM